ncbi:hypothetical protein CMI40_01245 [Candidatus Pacearchaeota archaeon]|jgi:homoserine kinase type II|nr:hypothetical protein [Candidatus Pacearchaeota archaeon]|tara:strand:- start:341 stop:1300 length:960 start_codon:yes stop_codon:yes gene_type:complete
MKLTKKEILKICEEYNLGKLKDIELIKGGLINHNFILKTNKGKFIIRIISRNPKQKDSEFKLLEYLHQKKFPYKTPLPLKNSSGEYILKLSKKNLWVYKFIKGEHTMNITDNHLKQIAIALAKFYEIVKNFKTRELKETWVFELGWLIKEYSKFKKINPKNKYDKLMVENADFFMNLSKEMMKYKKFRKNLSIVHTDTNHNNLLFNKNKLIGILDFDNIKYAPRAIDVSYGIQQFCRTKKLRFSLDRKRTKLFLKEYEKISKLTDKEKKMLLPLMIKYQCLLFWWFYTGMEKSLNKKYEYMKDTLELARNIKKLLDKKD